MICHVWITITNHRNLQLFIIVSTRLKMSRKVSFSTTFVFLVSQIHCQSFIWNISSILLLTDQIMHKLVIIECLCSRNYFHSVWVSALRSISLVSFSTMRLEDSKSWSPSRPWDFQIHSLGLNVSMIIKFEVVFYLQKGQVVFIDLAQLK